MAFRAVLFDFDYTLVDASEGILACVNYGLSAMGLEPVGLAQIRPLVGLALTEMFPRLTARTSAEEAEAFTRRFIAHADRVMADATRVFPWVQATLMALKRCGLRTGIVSTKFRYRITLTLEREALAPLVDVVIGAEDVAALKPSPEGLLKALAHLGTAAPSALYVGDSLTDAETAQRAGVPFVAVLSGATPAESFAAYPLHGILPHGGELPALLGC